MNIYIINEISSRELDSKLLIAILAAERGHQVIISDLEGIVKGTEKGFLAPGIFHTKSLTPTNYKLKCHKFFIDKGFKVTSLDEEAGIDLNGYEEFSKTRFSDKSIELASAVFGWGDDDVNTLKKKYSKYASRIHKTGSPRVDLWKSTFSSYWNIPKSIPKKPFLLVSSNMAAANGYLESHKIYELRRNNGYFDRDPSLIRKAFVREAEAMLKTGAFIEAIKYLAKNNNCYDIVLRPHPMENIKIWKTYLNSIPNAHVIREGPITPWVKNAFAVMHNGCTTALETTVSKKPLVTYMPFKTDFDNHPPNHLGHHAKSPEELSNILKSIFIDTKFKGQNKNRNEISKILDKKIFLDKNELAAEKIIKLWENLIDNNHSNYSNWTRFRWLLRKNKIRKLIGIAKRKILGTLKENNKFPPFKQDDIFNRIDRFQNITGIKDLKIQILSDRTLLIKKK
jgi:surface carbohydrate biosynthesis protein